MKNYKIRKGLFVRAAGTAGRMYQIINTTRKRATLKALDTGKVFRMERPKVLTLTTAIGYKLAIAA